MTGVAGFFAVLLLYRQRIGGAAVLGLVALLFALIALTAPKLLEPVEAAWMTFARVLGEVNTRILMGILFFLFIVPLGLFLKAFGRDEMKRRRVAGSRSNWEDYRARQHDKTHYENMF